MSQNFFKLSQVILLFSDRGDRIILHLSLGRAIVRINLRCLAALVLFNLCFNIYNWVKDNDSKKKHFSLQLCYEHDLFKLQEAFVK